MDVLERVADAERRVHDVAVLRDARVLEVEVAHADFLQQLRAEGVRVGDAAEQRRRVAVGRRRRGVGPPERLFDALRRAHEGEPRVVAGGGAMLHRDDAGPAVRLGRDDLLLQQLAAEGAVAAQHRHAAGGRRDQEAAVAGRVQDVDRDRMDVGRRQLAEGQRVDVAEERGDEAGLLIGREGAQRAQEVGGKGRVVGGAVAQVVVGDAGDGLGRPHVAEADRQAGRGSGVAGIAGAEPRLLSGDEEERAALADRTAHGAAGVVAAELGLGGTGAVEEELVGVHRLVLERVQPGPVVAVGAIAGDDVDAAAAVAALGRRGQRRRHLDLLERLQRHAETGAETTRRAQHVGRVDAVHPKRVVGRPRPVDARVQRLRAVLGLGAGLGGEVQVAAGAIGQRRRHAGLGHDHVRVVARRRRHVGEHLVREAGRQRRAIGVEADVARRHLDGFTQAVDAERGA